MSAKTCATCIYWQDYSDRVTAVVSGRETHSFRNRLELRRCRYVAPPSIETRGPVYTDADHSCSGWKE